MIRILGIDPGLRYTGWGIIDKSNDNKLKFVACGVISTPPTDRISTRLMNISKGIKEIVTEYKPDECAIEETFVNQNPMSSLKLGHARGTIIATLAIAGVPPYEYAATLIKKTVVGAGRAQKQQVQAMVECLLPKAVIKSEDAADALAVAICHTQHANINSLMESW